jgi:hypothetical protein
VLSQDPKNKEALYQVADIQYRKGEISKAEKPINFLLHDYERDPMGYYIKGVLEMEKSSAAIVMMRRLAETIARNINVNLKIFLPK